MDRETCAEVKADVSSSDSDGYQDCDLGYLEEVTEGAVPHRTCGELGEALHAGRILFGAIVGTLAIASIAIALSAPPARARQVALAWMPAEPMPGISLKPSLRALPALPASVLLASEDTEKTGSGTSSLEWHQPTVVFDMLIKNMNYMKLLAEVNFYKAFNATVKQAVSSVAGIGVRPRDVDLVVSAGSTGSAQAVAVQCSIAAGSVDLAESVRLAVASSSRLDVELALNLQALRLDPFAAVIVGRVDVAAVSTPAIYGTPRPTTATSGSPTTSRKTQPTAPPVTATTTRKCMAEDAACMLAFQCCSLRCNNFHRCAPEIQGQGMSFSV